MHNNRNKTTIIFSLGADSAHPVKVTFQNAVPAPDTKQIENFGGILAQLTGLPFQSATVATQDIVA